MIRTILRPLASLQLTVALFAMAVVLVFFGTLAQKNSGIWSVVDQYFWSTVVFIDPQLVVEFVRIFFNVGLETTYGGPKIPFPGGYLLGWAMFINLIAAHILRFKLSWKRSGIFIIHGGLLLMFINEYITREYAIEQQMPIVEGETANYTVDSRDCELAIVDGSGKDKDRVIAIPASRLKPGVRIDVPEVPFDVKATSYFANSKYEDISAAKGGTPAATKGYGQTLTIKELPVVSGVETAENKIDIPATQVQLLKKGTDEVIATYLLSMGLNDQPYTYEGKTWDLSLRNIRYYKPYTVKLNEIKVEHYPGSRIPKEYASKVVLSDPGRSVTNNTTIAMNEPMRYGGETFYQSGVMPGNKGTILQVVQNPGWLLPYASCAIVSFGLLLHFGMGLNSYLRRMFARKTTDDRESNVVDMGMATGLAVKSALTLNVGSLFWIAMWALYNGVQFKHIEQSRFEKRLPWIVLAVTMLLVVLGAMPHGKTSAKGIDLEAAGRLPVLEEGRVKPLDSAARVALRKLNHKESYIDPSDNKSRSALDWWFATATAGNADSSPGNKAAVIRIENDQMLNFFDLARRDGLRYSINEMKNKFGQFDKVIEKAKAKDKADRNIFDNNAILLGDKMQTWAAVWHHATRVVPPVEGVEWTPVTTGPSDIQKAAMAYIEKHNLKIDSFGALQEHLRNLKPEEQQAAIEELVEMSQTLPSAEKGVDDWKTLFAAYKAGDAEKFNAAVESLHKLAEERVSAKDRNRASLETFLNDTGLFWWCTALYVLAFLLTVAAWVCYSFDPGLGQAWRKSAVLVLLFTFAIHTFTLIARMYLMDRWLVFVTNLYSTAVFIGWAAVGLSLLVERVFPITLGCLTASVIGYLTTQLAHQLAVAGDTIEPMRAVLNTNFWLATHVTTINLGYAATYLAGAIGIAYLNVGIFTPHLRHKLTINGQSLELGKLIGQILYGAVAGATVLSFIGTVLGGIWGDQSWGRFWGWDPKENGALLIVIWNAMILHARWCGLIKDRGTAVLVLGGNMITTWSYFGTNQLGVGLHAYGFSNELALLCVRMWIANLVLIGIGLIPQRFWRSSSVPTKTA